LFNLFFFNQGIENSAKEEDEVKRHGVKDVNPNSCRVIFCASRPSHVTYKAKHSTLVYFLLKALYFSIILCCGVQSLQTEPNQSSDSDIHDRVTAFVSARGYHSHYCNNEPSESIDCSKQMSIKVWNYGEDNDDVRGMIEEMSEDGSTIKVKVDCMARTGINAIVGGDLIADHSGIQDEIPRKSRAYVHVHDGSGNDEIDVISGMLLVDTLNSDCSDILTEDFESLVYVVDSHVNVCYKHDINWEGCTARTDNFSGFAVSQ
jgi:hypothetical protein